MITATQLPVPSDGSVVTMLTNVPVNTSQVAVRNTGTVTVLLGGGDGVCLFPLQANEFIGIVVSPEDVLKAKVQTNGTAGQITLMSF